MRPRVLRARTPADLPSSEDVEEGGFAAGAVTTTRLAVVSKVQWKIFQSQERTEGPASGVLSCFLHRVALLRRGRERRVYGF